MHSRSESRSGSRLLKRTGLAFRCIGAIYEQIGCFKMAGFRWLGTLETPALSGLAKFWFFAKH